MKPLQMAALLAALTIVAAAGYLFLFHAQGPVRALAKQNSGGGVTITATYLGGGQFSVSEDTHSGSLDFPLDKNVYLSDGLGKTYRPVSWTGGSGGHHVNGTLTFPQFDDSKNFQLVITGVADVDQRVLQW